MDVSRDPFFLILASSWTNSVNTKMVAGTYATRRKQHSMENGFHKGSNGLASQERIYSAEVQNDFEEPPLFCAVMTYMSYFLLIIFGYMRDFMRKYGLEKSRGAKETGNEVRE